MSRNTRISDKTFGGFFKIYEKERGKLKLEIDRLERRKPNWTEEDKKAYTYMVTSLELGDEIMRRKRKKEEDKIRRDEMEMNLAIIGLTTCGPCVYPKMLTDLGISKSTAKKLQIASCLGCGFGTYRYSKGMKELYDSLNYKREARRRSPI